MHAVKLLGTLLLGTVALHPPPAPVLPKQAFTAPFGRLNPIVNSDGSVLSNVESNVNTVVLPVIGRPVTRSVNL